MLPLSRSTTYVSGSPPAISARDLNDLQDYLALIYNLLGLPSVSQVSGGDSPRAQLKDTGGNVRWLIDHNGYPMGRRCEWRKEWYSIADGSMFTQPDSVNPAGGTANYPANIAKKNGGATNGTNYCALTNLVTHLGFTGLSLVLEMELSFSTLAATNTVLFAGLLDSTGPVTAANLVGFRRLAGGTNWNGFVTGAAQVDLGVAPASGTTPTQRLRLEVHGSASPYGSGSNGKVRFFVNEVLRGEIAAVLPSVGVGICIGSGVTGGAASDATDAYMGPALATWNRALSLAAL